MMRRTFAGAILVTTALAACDWLPLDGGPDLAGAWELERGTFDGELIEVPEGSRITMTIEGSDLGGTAACNHYGGTFELDGWSISIGALSMTEMACDEPTMSAEAAFLAALADVDTVERSRSLVLTGPASELRFMILAPVPEAEIVDTAWRLDSLIGGDAVSSVAGEPATLELASGGTLSGSTGCRSFSGTYAIAGDEVEVTQLTTDLRPCPRELAAQDGHVIGVLEGGVTASVEGNRLTVMSGVDGLAYVADE